MDFNQIDIHQILKIVDETEHLAEIELVINDFKLHIRRYPDSGSAQSRAPVVERETRLSSGEPAPSRENVKPAGAPAASCTETLVPDGMLAIRAPMLGSFYRSPAPGEKPFVEVGQKVKADDTVGVIEVMKLFNSISAGVAGVVREILAEDAGLVEYGQVLLLVEPNA